MSYAAWQADHARGCGNTEFLRFNYTFCCPWVHADPEVSTIQNLEHCMLLRVADTVCSHAASDSRAHCPESAIHSCPPRGCVVETRCAQGGLVVQRSGVVPARRASVLAACDAAAECFVRLYHDRRKVYKWLQMKLEEGDFEQQKYACDMLDKLFGVKREPQILESALTYGAIGGYC
eukprot:4096728-Amphidinium_carterae.1